MHKNSNTYQQKMKESYMISAKDTIQNAAMFNELFHLISAQVDNSAEAAMLQLTSLGSVHTGAQNSRLSRGANPRAIPRRDAVHMRCSRCLRVRHVFRSTWHVQTAAMLQQPSLCSVRRSAELSAESVKVSRERPVRHAQR